MEVKISLRFICIIILIFAIVFFTGFWSGSIRSSRLGSAEIGDIRAKFEQQLAGERERITELERINLEDGTTISGLREENQQLRDELGNADGFINSLDGILKRDASTIDGIIQLIRDLRGSIRTYKESLDNNTYDSNG